MDAGGTAVQDVGVDHSRGDVLMAEELLDRADVAAVFEQVGSEGMAEGVACGALRDARREDGAAHGVLDDGLVQVVALASTQIGACLPSSRVPIDIRAPPN